jgi:hypothetical protein
MKSFIPKQIWEISASSWFYCKKFITMHGHINIKQVTLYRGNLTYLNVLKEGSAFIFKDLPTLENEGTVLF